MTGSVPVVFTRSDDRPFSYATACQCELIPTVKTRIPTYCRRLSGEKSGDTETQVERYLSRRDRH